MAPKLTECWRGKRQSSQMADWQLLHPIIDTASLCHNRKKVGKVGLSCRLCLMGAILTHHCEVVGFKIPRT